ncbi:hypothetical protein GDO86_005848 [Hymenochirus boettgeri]|uniref:Ubiquitin-like domain-containing protein n=1 Tax=Hymenochirus boettgeri TaxID=247094 RepID=A0A8T2J673_9PIPI|nr:hypothetical protein GDO86_005848 [Hymenochirus boettgeri]
MIQPDSELTQESVSEEKEFEDHKQILEEQAQKPTDDGDREPYVDWQSYYKTSTQMSDVETKQPNQETEYVHLENLQLATHNAPPEERKSVLNQEHVGLKTENPIIIDQHTKEVSMQAVYYIDEELENTEHKQTIEQEVLVSGYMTSEELKAPEEEERDNLEQRSHSENRFKNLTLTEETSATATVKMMLIPVGEVVTVAFSINYSVGHLKKYFALQMKIPETLIQIKFEGRVAEDQETLVNLGVTPHGTIQLDMLSLDPDTFPVKALKLQNEYSMPDVITVRVQTGDDTYQDIAVEIERLNYRKPYLGGYRHKVTGVVFYHAGTQTVPKKRPDRGVVVFCRDTQTVQSKNKAQQSRNTMSTQMTKIGCYVANMTGQKIIPKRYVTAEDFMLVLVIQTYFRRFRAKKVVEQLKEEKRLRLEWEAMEDLRKDHEKEYRMKKDYERRMNPKTKDDFDLLYRALELWRKEELENINQTLTGAERKAALCTLLEQEARLISSIGRHKINADEENQQKAIKALLNKCSEPKKWKAFDGKTTEMDTQYTIRARQLRDIYTSINTPYFNNDERLDVLLTLKLTVKEHDCKLTQEIVELIDREADLLLRGVKNANLEGLRKRISTLFLQYIKTPTFNPEVARLLKVPEESSILRRNIYFCPSCKSYLPSTDFSLSANAREMGRCRKCSKLDNEAREREEFSKYKILLNNLKKSESDYGDKSRITFLLQQQDLKYLIENIWAGHSALSACDDLHYLVMVRWDKYLEWSPWNCILLTKDEAAAHLKLVDAQKAYGIVFIHKIKHRHSLAKNYFSQIQEMAPYLHGENVKQMPTTLI